MSEEEKFLMRWSRRKRDAAAESRETPLPAPEGDSAPPAATDAAAAAPEPPVLPPIDSIGANSEVSEFLKAGVPADLSRAALRRAWSTDPVISSFVGLSENSWDFNAVDGVPGFGPIKAEDVARLLKRVMGEPEEGEAEATPSAAASPAEGPKLPSDSDAASDAARADQVAEPDKQGDPSAQAPVYKANAAVRDEVPTGESVSSSPRRRHGGALPD